MYCARLGTRTHAIQLLKNRQRRSSLMQVGVWSQLAASVKLLIPILLVMCYLVPGMV